MAIDLRNAVFVLKISCVSQPAKQVVCPILLRKFSGQLRIGLNGDSWVALKCFIDFIDHKIDWKVSLRFATIVAYGNNDLIE